MDRESALAKIKKCLQLARSANTHEAAAAMRQAQALMRMHGVNETAVKFSDVNEAETPVRSAALPAWGVWLAQSVAAAFGCELIVMRGHRLSIDDRYRRTKFQFIGVGAAAQVAAYAQEVLGGQCQKARLAHIQAQPKNCKQITKTARGDAFAKAWVRAVESLLDRFASGERSAELLLAYKADRHPQLTTIKPVHRDVDRNVKDSSYADGFRSGTKARLDLGLGAPEARRLLKG